MRKKVKHTRIPCGTAECWEIANSQSASWFSEGKFPYTGQKKRVSDTEIELRK